MGGCRTQDMHERITSTTLAVPVEGPGVDPAPLGSVLTGQPTLLVFLRHFG